MEPHQQFIVRAAVSDDIPDIMRLKLALATADNIAWTVRATAADWARDGFGTGGHFTIFVAECAGSVVGMVICAERHSPGWVGPVIVLYDLYVEPAFRRRGIASALVTRIAALAKACDSVMVELQVRAGNRAAALYEHMGFIEVTEARNYVLAGTALDAIAAPKRTAAA